jgi:hypothetical protein
MAERTDSTGTGVEEKVDQKGQTERKTGTGVAEPSWPKRVLEVKPLDRELPAIEEID